MLVNRVVPVLLLKGGLLVKTRGFKKPVYVGDPVNAVRIFNEKEVDELVILDMDPSRSGSRVNLSLIEEIAGEAFMPIAYGGGVTSVARGSEIVRLGVEKLVINTAWSTDPHLIPGLASTLGSQSVVGAVDFRRRRGGNEVHTHGGTKRTGRSAVTVAESLVKAGAGEIFLNSIDRDGTMSGFDLDCITEVSRSVPVPVLASGGAGTTQDLEAALRAGASAVAASSMFVFHGKHRAVLITYPSRSAIEGLMERAPVG